MLEDDKLVSQIFLFQYCICGVMLRCSFISLTSFSVILLRVWQYGMTYSPNTPNEPIFRFKIKYLKSLMVLIDKIVWHT